MASDTSDFGPLDGDCDVGAARAQAGRIKVISENIANADSTGTTSGRRSVPCARSRPSPRRSTARWTPRSWHSAGWRPTGRRFA